MADFYDFDAFHYDGPAAFDTWSRTEAAPVAVADIEPYDPFEVTA